MTITKKRLINNFEIVAEKYNLPKFKKAYINYNNKELNKYRNI